MAEHCTEIVFLDIYLESVENQPDLAGFVPATLMKSRTLQQVVLFVDQWAMGTHLSLMKGDNLVMPNQKMSEMACAIMFCSGCLLYPFVRSSPCFLVLVFMQGKKKEKSEQHKQ